MRYQHLYVFLSLSQRRQRDRKDAQAVIQIGTKAALADRILQVAISGRDHAYVHLYRVAAADSFKLTFFKHAQELGLQVQRQLADFIEKERAAIRDLKTPAAFRVGSGERAALVAEQFALDERPRQRRTVHFDERMIIYAR